MVRKEINDPILKTILDSVQRDGLGIFLLDDDTYRLVRVHATHLVNEMSRNHELEYARAAALGEASISALLVSSTMKNEEHLGMLFESDGGGPGFSVDADSSGNVRGHLTGTDEQRVGTIWGPGILSVIRYNERTQRPYQGTVRTGGSPLPLLIERYFSESDQTPTRMRSIIVRDDGDRIVNAAGLLLQAMPGADPDRLNRFDELIAGGIPRDDSELIRQWGVRRLMERPVRFYCGCSRERFSKFLSELPPAEKREILEETPMPLSIRCHNCNTEYLFTREELVSIF